MPQKRAAGDSGMPSASALIDRPEVLEAKIASGADERGHPCVEIELPVHPSGDGFDE